MKHGQLLGSIMGSILGAKIRGDAPAERLQGSSKYIFGLNLSLDNKKISI